MGNKVYLLTNSNEYNIPDMTNWSMGDVKTYCTLTKLKCEFNGYGYVISQSFPAGSPITIDSTIQFELKEK